MRRSVAVLAISAAAAGLAAAPAGAAGLDQFTKQQVTWAPCVAGPAPEGYPQDEWEKSWAGLDCATVLVPLDYRHPGNGSLSIAVSRRKAADPAKRQGVLMLNPGGPGGSGLQMPSAFTENAIAQSFDLIGFDPRGVGRSTQLRCEVTPYGPWLNRPTDAQFAQIAAEAKAREEACQRAGGGMRPYINTPNTARDMDVIRAVLGEKKINYLGFSYGTYLGAVYGSLFPSHLGRNVLDSSMHPDWFYYEASKQQAVAAKQNVDAWVAWVAQRDKTYHLGTTPAKVTASLDALGEKLAAKPVPWPGAPAGFPDLDRNIFDQVLGGNAGPRRMWALLAELVVQIQQATLSPDAGKALAVLAKWSIAETESGVFPTVTCEADWPTDLNVYYEQMRLFREKYPYGPGAMSAAPTECAFRSFTPPERMVDLVRKGYQIGVVVQAEFDPATQYDGGPAMASKLGDALISVRDEGTHGQYGRNACVTKAIDDYLVNGVLPGSRTVCAGAPRPDVSADKAALTAGSLADRAAALVKEGKLDRGF